MPWEQPKKWQKKNPTNTKAKNTCTHMFTAALFTIAKTWKQPKCPLTDKEDGVHMYNLIFLSHDPEFYFWPLRSLLRCKFNPQLGTVGWLRIQLCCSSGIGYSYLPFRANP